MTKITCPPTPPGITAYDELTNYFKFTLMQVDGPEKPPLMHR